jgi:hypothetical protein
VDTNAYQVMTENEAGVFDKPWGPVWDTKKEAETYSKTGIYIPYKVVKVDLHPGTIAYIAREKGIALNDIDRINAEVLKK